MKIGITGHRILSHSYESTKEALILLLKEQKATQLISGLALGFDLLAAEAALELKIPLVAALPFVEQTSSWNEKDQKKYLEILSKASSVYIVPMEITNKNINSGYFARNRYIVENSDLLIAYIIDFDNGGTAYTWNYANKKKVERKNLVDALNVLPGVL